MYRLPRAPNSSVSPSFDSSFVFALFFLLTTFLCSKVEGFPYGRKRFCLSWSFPHHLAAPQQGWQCLGTQAGPAARGSPVPWPARGAPHALPALLPSCCCPSALCQCAGAFCRRERGEGRGKRAVRSIAGNLDSETFHLQFPQVLN